MSSENKARFQGQLFHLSYCDSKKASFEPFKRPKEPCNELLISICTMYMMSLNTNLTRGP